MRMIAVLCVLFLSACQASQSGNGNGLVVARADSLSGETVKKSLLDKTSAEILPIAEAMCRRHNPDKAAEFCEFRISVHSNSNGLPSASHRITKDGRPLLTLSQSLIDAVDNEDELAFVLAHEAGHQIANHNQRLGGTQFKLGLSETADVNSTGTFDLVRVNLKRLELEADVIGTILLHNSRFSPLVGAMVIRKLASHTINSSRTHPVVDRREAVVAKTIKHQQQGHKIDFN